jgi:hypothetical protein
MCLAAPYKYVDREPIRTITKNGRRKTKEEILGELKHIPNGVIGWGYVEPSAENVSFLCQSHRVNYFIYRDPRDMLISQIFFATDMHEEHGMHTFYNSLPDFGEGYKIPTGRAKAMEILVGVIQPKKSRTFRLGKTGGWKEHFTVEHKKLFKDVAGDLMVRLGYEKNNDW